MRDLHATMKAMCRTGGRRCDAKWGDVSRERYNARRRVTRNSEKAQVARGAGNEAQARYYDDLAGSAREAAQQYDALIQAHESEEQASESPRHPLASQDSEPVDFPFVRNPQSLAGNQAANLDFGQDVEPAGRYMTHRGEGGDPPDGWQSGVVRFEQPLHISWGDSGLYTTDDNWKRRLSAHYGGATGKKLSRALRNDGYDAVITHDKYGTSEVVDITHLSPSAKAKAKARPPEKCGLCGQWADASSHTCPQQATREELRSTSQDWRSSWSDEESEAVDSYSSIEHAGLNQKLREGTPLSGDEAATVQALDSVTSRAPRTEGAHTLYRGVGFSEVARGEASAKDWVAESCREGDVIELGGFTSMSTSHSSAEYFSGARSEHVTSGVVFEVETTHAGYTRDSAEDEVLMGRGSRFEVVSVDDETELAGKPIQHVRLREVVPAAAPAGSPWDSSQAHSPSQAHTLGSHLEAKHGVRMELSGGAKDDSYVTLHRIEVPTEQRGSGVGKAAMRDLVEEADRHGWKLDLTPAGDFGGNVSKLKRFYKEFGFVENKGRNKDYGTKETFLRAPKGA